MQAMEGAPADVREEVAVKQSFFAKWSDKAKSMRLEALMKELNSHWKKFMKCVKADKGCPRSLVWTIRGILATILALVAVGAVYKAKPEWFEDKRTDYPDPELEQPPLELEETFSEQDWQPSRALKEDLEKKKVQSRAETAANIKRRISQK